MDQVRRFPHRPSPAAAIAPALAPDGRVPPEIDRQLAALARRAANGDAPALDALYTACTPRIRHWIVRAQRTLAWRGADPALEPEDIAQQAFVVFAELVLAWDGCGSFSAYAIAYFNWRLRDAIRAMTDRRARIELDIAPGEALHDGSHAADEALSLLDDLAARLDDRAGAVLHLRVCDDLPWTEIARRLGIDRRTALRDWRRVRLLAAETLVRDA